MEEIPTLIQIAILLLIVTVIAFIVYVRRAKKIEAETPKQTARLGDIPAIINSLATHGEDGTWVMFILPQTESSDENDITIQFSVENGTVGFDWLLDNGLGNAHRKKFEEFARRRGWPVVELEMAGFHYLRIQDLSPSQIAEIGKEVLSTLYHVSPTQEVEIQDDAPEWRVGA